MIWYCLQGKFNFAVSNVLLSQFASRGKNLTALRNEEKLFEQDDTSAGHFAPLVCMLCYFHIWFACNKKYRKKYQAKQQGGQQDQLETGLSGLHSTVDGKIFEVQHDGTRKQVAEFNDFSLIWRHLYRSAGAYYMAVTFFMGKERNCRNTLSKILMSHMGSLIL